MRNFHVRKRNHQQRWGKAFDHLQRHEVREFIAGSGCACTDQFLNRLLDSAKRNAIKNRRLSTYRPTETIVVIAVQNSFDLGLHSRAVRAVHGAPLRSCVNNRADEQLLGKDDVGAVTGTE